MPTERSAEEIVRAKYSKDSPLMKEARELVSFYDERGWNWESALAFIMCKDLFGSAMRVHPIEGYRCYPYPKRRPHQGV